MQSPEAGTEVRAAVSSFRSGRCGECVRRMSYKLPFVKRAYRRKPTGDFPAIKCVAKATLHDINEMLVD